MGRSLAQAAAVSIGGNQTVEIINPVEAHSVAQAATVTLATAQLVVICNPAQKLPNE